MGQPFNSTFFAQDLLMGLMIKPVVGVHWYCSDCMLCFLSHVKMVQVRTVVPQSKETVTFH